MAKDTIEVAAVLPHRYPFLLVDRVVELEVGRRIVALKNVTANEPFFSGHFPGRPIMPGVLLCEAVAQAGGILVHATAANADGGSKIAMLTALDRVRFRQQVTPGDQLRLEVEAVRRRGPFWKMRGAALVAGKIVAELEFTVVFAAERNGGESA
ncbi:MAG: 3-hydroxyacyl-ACP dehydratase FabZ [Deltaproteobacteria bacterium]|nr:3-hydroxyacyl-ACP dehydratase FabZ [Deltaproteobacteria bacterium]